MINTKIKVLIVDDQALVLDILSRGLSKDPNIEIVGTATDGQIALNIIPRLKPDVIILDMEMPRMNGLEMLQKLMPINPIPTIVLSALTFKDSKLTQQAFELGAVDFLSKPSGGARALPGLLSQLWTKIKIAAAQDVNQFKQKVKKYKLASTFLDRKAKINQSILGMGASETTKEEGKLLKIFALGSCVGVALFCPSKRIVSLIHIVLPASKNDKEKAENIPGYFADTGIVHILGEMNKLGCINNNIFAKIAGGAKTSVDIGDYFSIGQRNSVAVKATLLKNKIKIRGENIGGNISRTVWVTPGNDNYNLHHPEKGNWTL